MPTFNRRSYVPQALRCFLRQDYPNLELLIVDDGSDPVRDCVPDVDGAARELRRRGYRELFLAGHSTGANKVAVYDRLAARSRFKRYILLAGGDDTALLHDARLLSKARAMIKARRGDELMWSPLREISTSGPKAPVMASFRAGHVALASVRSLTITSNS